MVNVARTMLLVLAGLPRPTVKSIQGQMFKAVTFTNENAITARVLAGSESMGFNGLSWLDVYAITVRCLAVNFLESSATSCPERLCRPDYRRLDTRNINPFFAVLIDAGKVNPADPANSPGRRHSYATTLVSLRHPRVYHSGRRESEEGHGGVSQSQHAVGAGGAGDDVAETVLDRFVTEYLFRGDYSALNRIEERVKRTKQRLDNFSNSLLIPGAAITGALGITVKTTADFEDALNRASCCWQPECRATGPGTGTGSAVRPDYSFHCHRRCKCHHTLQAGLSLNEVLAATPHVLSNAAAAEIDLARSAELVTQATNSFGLSMDDANTVVDLASKGFGLAQCPLRICWICWPGQGQQSATTNISIQGHRRCADTIAD